MKDIIRFKSVGGLTFSEKSPIIINREEKINQVLSMLGIVSLIGSIFWDDIVDWFRKRVV